MLWTDTNERRFRSVLVEPDVAEGLFTTRFWQLFSWVVTPRDTGGGPAPLRYIRPLSAERDYQVARLERVREDLDQLRQWPKRSGRVIVYDTNALIHYKAASDIEWKQVVGVDSVRLVVPLIVVDELDRKRYGTDSNTVSRAKAAQRVLLDLLGDTQPGRETVVPSKDGTVTLEVFMDERGHRRLQYADDEIIDRAILMQQLLGSARPVFILTHDAGMRFRADAAGIKVIRLPDKYSKEQTAAPLGAALTIESRRATELGSRLNTLADRASEGAS